MTAVEETNLRLVEQFSESSFPPKISLIRELPDWGHPGFYAIYGRLHSAVKGDLGGLRAMGLAIVLVSLFVFIRLGRKVTYRNRLNPLWISLAVIFLAANPYAWGSAFHVDRIGMLLLFTLLAMHLFESDLIGGAAICTSIAVLMDFRALLLALAFLLTRITGEQSRLLRPERMIAFILPFAVGALPLLGWQGVVPPGEAQRWLATLRADAPAVRPEGLFYALCLLPLYAPMFCWAWGIRARSQALVVGAVATAVCVPLYFMFPVHFDWWDKIRLGEELPLGLVDQGAIAVAGPYKNLLLFVPWLAGAFLFSQLVLMDVLDRSRWLRYFILFFLVVLPFVGAGDREFLILVPAVLLLSLSEALVGEEGKLA